MKSIIFLRTQTCSGMPTSLSNQSDLSTQIKLSDTNCPFIISGERKFCPFKPVHQPRLSLPQVQQHSGNLSKTLTIRARIRNGEVRFPQKEGEIQHGGAIKEGNSFWAAVSLIIGTAVGPGMLGLPAATMKSGILPSTIAIILSWVYVISSILLVAELSYVTMEEDGLDEVSFTGLATKAFGTRFGALVSVVSASLSLSLLIACVSGIGSIFSKCFPWLNVFIAHALFPFVVASLLWFFPFQAIDVVNRSLCFMMLFSITALVGIGSSMSMAGGRGNLFGSLAHASWDVSSLLPAIPVAVLTLGFHVITPFICSLAGSSLNEVRKAIIIGGAVPLIMVLSWNMIVHGLAGAGGSSSSYSGDPISLLLSVRSSALVAIQGFAFSALATSLIGYAVSFPKQLFDTLMLFLPDRDNQLQTRPPMSSNYSGVGKAGISNYYSGAIGNAGTVFFHGRPASHQPRPGYQFVGFGDLVLPVVLIISVVVASYYQSTFSRALDFAGVYANCFLFGILPPLMTSIYKSKRKLRSSILPGGDGALLLLFSIAVVLGIWH
ncbi:hypothetical protein Dimus_012548 [Dionaea muscipula]